MHKSLSNTAADPGKTSLHDTEREKSSLPKILIVDDEPRVLRSLQAALRFKFDVTTAQSGFQAQEIMRDSERFDVIVCDQRMPKFTGHDLLEWARENHPYCVRIMLTSSDFDSVRDCIDSAEVYRYLSKPWNMKELENVLDKAVLKSQEMVDRALKQQLPAIYQQCIIAVLDPDTSYHESYELLGQDIEGISDTYFFDSAKEIIASISQIEGVGLLLLDLATGMAETAGLIRKVNLRYPSVSIFVTGNPASLTKFISTFGSTLDYQYITKPMSFERIKPMMLKAVAKYNQ